MYRTFEVRNFKGIQHLALEAMPRIALITGANNVGKSAVLEAILAHSFGANASAVLTLLGLRGVGSLHIDLLRPEESSWASFFYDFRTSEPIDLSAELTSLGNRASRITHVADPNRIQQIGGLQPGQERPVIGFTRSSVELSGIESPAPAQVLELTFFENTAPPRNSYLILSQQGVRVLPPIATTPPLASYFIGGTARGLAEDAERFSRLEMNRQTDLLLEALRIIEPRLSALRLLFAGGVAGAAALVQGGAVLTGPQIPVGNAPEIGGDIGLTHLLPLKLMGDGMSRLNSIVLAISAIPGGVVLIDEVDTGLHHSVLEKVWRGIDTASRRFNTQVIATTHSFECIQALYSASESVPDFEPVMYRLERKEGEVRAVAYDREALGGAIANRFEVR